MPTIKVAQWGVPFESRKGTILDAALAAGVPFPYSCQVGECGRCKSRLVAGKVTSLEPADPAVLTKSERAAGVILPCRAWPKTDVTVAWLADMRITAAAPIRELRARVIDLEDATNDIMRVRLEVDGPPLEFSAGQYARLRFGRLAARSYSMANRPDEPVLEFHIRRVPGGIASGYLAEQLRLGEIVWLEGPYGTATLQPTHDGPVIAAAGGSGLAPIKSIVRTALAKQLTNPIHLYFGVPDERDVYDEEELRALAASHPNLQVEIVLSAACGPAERRTGFVHEAIAADFPDLGGIKFYIAGPPPMVDALTTLARSRGTRADDIHADAFAPSAVASRSPELLPRLRRLFRRSPAAL